MKATPADRDQHPAVQAMPKHAFEAPKGTRFCIHCSLSAINPIHRSDPYERGPVSHLKPNRGLERT